MALAARENDLKRCQGGLRPRPDVVYRFCSCVIHFCNNRIYRSFTRLSSFFCTAFCRMALQNRLTSGISGTTWGTSILMVVPCPSWLTMSRLKSVPYSTRKRSLTLLSPIPSTYT